MQVGSGKFVITGGCSGLGLATATLFLSKGARVCALDLFPDSEEIQQLVSQYGADKVLVRKADVTNAAQIQAILEELYGLWGEVSGVVNCAGVLSAGKLVHRKQKYQLTPKDVMRTLRINVVGTYTGI